MFVCPYFGQLYEEPVRKGKTINIGDLYGASLVTINQCTKEESKLLKYIFYW